MPKVPFPNRQPAIGGAIGMVLLAFALVYRFFPAALKVEPSALQARPASVASAASSSRLPSGKLTPAEAERLAGPPLSLAPAGVLAARARADLLLARVGKGQPAPWLRKASAAARAGNLIGSDPASALSLTLAAAQALPDDIAVQRAISLLHARLLANAHLSLASGDADAARADYDALLRLPGESGDLATLAARIDAAAAIRPLLEKAATMMQRGVLEGPGDSNALAVYRKVLGLDPENVVARQGLESVQKAVLDRALTLAAQSDDTRAARALADAASILPASPALAATRARIGAIRAGRSASLIVQARSALEASNLDLAQKLAEQSAALGGNVDVLLVQIQRAREYASYQPGQVFNDGFLDIAGQAPSMVVIPRGDFLMGTSQRGRSEAGAEEPQHRVDLSKGFALARSEVTVGQFRAFVRAAGYVPDSERLGGASVYDEGSGRMQLREGANWQDDYAGHRADDDEPVVNVSWNDAGAYADWLAKRTGKRYRLPTEAEFEYAARGGTATTYWWGDGAPKDKLENLTGSGDRSPAHRSWANAFKGYSDGYWGPAPVMSFKANAFGLYDISGNVSEWVEDCWHDNYVRAPADGSAWVNPGCSHRVIRSGSWGSAPEQDRSAYRMGTDADARSGRVGFRVARDL